MSPNDTISEDAESSDNEGYKMRKNSSIVKPPILRKSSKTYNT